MTVMSAFSRVSVLITTLISKRPVNNVVFFQVPQIQIFTLSQHPDDRLPPKHRMLKQKEGGSFYKKSKMNRGYVGSAACAP
ncbi:hypothetical protein BC829DRAFT_66627 [Chytridium lagenaria]|nr:hypothetical protein BC829DRAFT_66627 [Chytridium lagenaria]